MATAYPELFKALAADFDQGEVKWRPQGGKQVPYITARVVMNRLDNVLGPCGWWDDYEPHEHSCLCKLTIRLPDGTTITKQDAGGPADMKDEGDGEKAAYSDSFKRAAVKFGIGRILYGDGSPTFTPPPLRSSPAASETTPPQSTPRPALDKDTRTAWQLLSDAAAKYNDRYREAIGDPGAPNLTDAASLAGRLLYLAWEQGRCRYEPGPDMSKKDIAHHVEELYGNGRGWVVGELKRLLTEAYDAAVREASVAKGEGTGA
jgi:hypothetical protein